MLQRLCFLEKNANILLPDIVHKEVCVLGGRLGGGGKSRKEREKDGDIPSSSVATVSMDLSRRQHGQAANKVVEVSGVTAS